MSMDGQTMALPRPFMVLATQNPYDAAGTSPLPHGQRDRFLLRLSLGYPSRSEEDQLIARADDADAAVPLAPALSRPELDALMRGVSAVHVSTAARGYVLDLVLATRSHPSVAVGASPRASLALRRVSKALALGGRAPFRHARGHSAGHRALARAPPHPQPGERAGRNRH